MTWPPRETRGDSVSRPHWQEVGELLWLAAQIAGRANLAARSPSATPPTADEPDTSAPPDRDTGADLDAEAPDPGTEPDSGADPLTGVAPFPGPDEVPALLVGSAGAPGTHRRSLTQAARSFRRTVPAPHRPSLLDEEATADRAAQDGLWLPVLTEQREPLLDLDLVLDDRPCAELHRDRAQRFVHAITDACAFRRIRLHLLDSDVKTEPELWLRDPGPEHAMTPAHKLAIPRRTGRRLIIVLTDGVGAAWHSGAAHRLLAQWGQSCTVSVVHLLPARLWRRTGVDAVRTTLRNTHPAAPNEKYEAGPPHRTGVHIPVLEAETETDRVEAWARQVTAWAELVMGSRAPWLGATIACSLDASPPPQEEPAEPFSAEQRVQRFRMDVSPTAFRLAVHLAAAPLSTRVIRHVQRTLLPRSTEAHLAELLGSDLVRLAGPQTTKLPVPVAYDFAPGVRQELLLAGRRSETAQVLVTWADHLGEEVGALRGLRDVIVAPGLAALPEVSEELSPLMDPAVSAMEAMAGPYIRPARLLKDALSVSEDDQSVAADRSDGMGAGNEQRDLSEDNVYQHITNEAQSVDPFGVSVNMSALPVARKRESHEPTPVWNVPQKNQSFTGREELLSLLHERLSTGTTAVLPEALHGLGGVGKSQIAIEYCYRHQRDYDLIWWIPSERLTMVRQAFVNLAEHLSLNVTEPAVAVPAVKEALRLGKPYADWLLVFDNAEDVDEIRRFFPTNGPGKIMITSRSRDWFSHAAPLEVDVFRREESRQLLRARGPELTDKDADELSERLGDLPLAIEQAAVWLSETGMPISEYLQLFDEQRRELLSVEGAEVPVAAAWNVSFERLRQSHPAALQLLQVCAFFAPEPIPRSLLTSTRDLEGPPELLQALADPIELGRTTRAISQYALAKINHRDNTISLHRLVQRVVTSQLSEGEANMFRHCGHMLLANADPRDPGNRGRWSDYQALFPHVFSSKLEDCPDSWARDLFLNLVDFLYLWGDNEGYRALAQRAVDAWTVNLGPDHDATLKAELRLGRALRLFAEFENAYRHHLHVRDVLRDRLGADHERTLEAQGYLGADLRYLGRFAEAVEIDQQAYETLRRRFGPDDPLTLEQAHLLGIDWRLNGAPDRARTLDQETLQRKEEVLGPDHLSTTSTRSALIIDEMECGRYVEAFHMQEQHVNVMRRRYKNSHPGTMDAIALLSVMARKAGHHDEALKLSEEALSLFRARYGEKYQNTVAISMNHAVNLRHIGDLSTSAELGGQARDNYEQLFGARHPNTPTADVNVAVSLRLMGRFDKARELDAKALAALTEMVGDDHPRSLVCAVNLASDLNALGEFEQALDLDLATLARLRRVHGDEHPTTLACALNLSLDMRALGREAEASALLADTLAGYRRTLGADHPAILAAAQGKRANCDIYPIPL
ncbi:FxSxx-COOH system tetratricopeptide repeat protein [Nonomuraea sp. NPDC046570]|uniref:FxSxx-COOH system tetratricopeptide repeat protein n=1 Tax=Nonomuraea sp. NPDC046570 TaxID=3155255 RepID=UPI0033EED62B